MKENLIRVLQILIGGERFTGVASYLDQYYKHMDRSRVCYDFLFCRQNSMAIRMDDPMFSNSLFYELNAVTNSGSNDYLRIMRQVRIIAKREQYDAVVVNTSVASIVIACIFAIFPRRIPCFIAHAHNAEIILDESALRRKYALIFKVTDAIFRFITNRYSSYLFACSAHAGRMTFGKGAIRKKNFRVIHNAIDTDKFGYSANIRNRVRSSMGLDGSTCVYGTVGRFSKGKNIKFVVEVFAEIQKSQSDSELWLIGEGDEERRIVETIAALQLQESVKILGQRTDVHELMQAMDGFVFATLSEGLGIVAIEAQAAGLPTFISDGVPKEAIITDLVHQLPLSKNAAAWGNMIVDAMETVGPREDRRADIVNAGYDIFSEAKWMTDFYAARNADDG